MNETTDATAIFPPIWRRKWWILITALLVAAGTYFYYKHQPAKFSATTQVYLGAAAESPLAEKTGARNPVTSGANQAALINTVVVESAKVALRKSTVTIDKVAAKGKVKAKAPEKSEFISITAESHSARGAALLANTVAAGYIKRWTATHQRNVLAAIDIARRQLNRLEAAHATVAPSDRQRVEKRQSGDAQQTAGGSSVIQAAQLSSKINQLEAQLAIVGVRQVKPAQAAVEHAALAAPAQERRVRVRDRARAGLVCGFLPQPLQPPAATLSPTSKRPSTRRC